MHLARRTLVMIPLLAAALAAPAQASIPHPSTDVVIDLVVGQTFKFKLSNANGCNFDYTTSVGDPLRLSVDAPTGTDKKNATIVVTAEAVGSTMFTAMTSGGSNPCPPATHIWQVNVTADLDGMLKDYGKLTKSELKLFKSDFKLAFNDYSAELKGLNAGYKDDTLTDDQLQDGFHLAAETLRNSIALSAALRYESVIVGGSEALAANGIDGQGPMEFFAGGGGDFDKFQDGVCSTSADFHDRFSKASLSGINSFVKSGAPRLAQWTVLPPIVASGPFYAPQATVTPVPQLFTAPLSLTLRPTTNEARDNGRLLVSGQADPGSKGDLHVRLTRFHMVDPPVELDTTVVLDGNAWSTSFSNLKEGAWTLSVEYDADVAAVDFPLHVGSFEP